VIRRGNMLWATFHSRSDDMSSALASSYLLTVFVFLVGISVGWRLATICIRSTIRSSASPVRTGSDALTRSLVTAKTYRIGDKVCLRLVIGVS
jgi:hypothetical protein